MGALTCESVQKEFRDLTDFYQREAGAHVLEGNRQSGSYRWMEIDTRRLASGSFNPDEMDEAYRLHHWILEVIQKSTAPIVDFR